MGSTWSAGVYFSTIIGLMWSAATATAAQVVAPFPLEKGMRWVYEGKVEWTVVNSTRVLWTNVHWVMEVADMMEGSSVRVSVIRGLPDELSWYEPGRIPESTVLVSITNHLYRIGVKSEQDGKKLARGLTDGSQKLPESADEWLVFPMAKGKRWGGDLEREDCNYCWYVEARKPENLRIQGYPAKPPADVWSLIYRTNPDHQIMNIVEGLGITRYVYAHHGTVAAVDVRLISFSHP